MKKLISIFLIIPAILALFLSASAQTDGMTLIASLSTQSTGVRLVWDESGNWITVISRDEFIRCRAEAEPMVQADGSSFPAFSSEGYNFSGQEYAAVSAGRSGAMAALSKDRHTVYFYEEPADSEKTAKPIEPGFTVLSVSVSEDGSAVLADSADEIRTVIYNTADGSVRYDLSGFATAAPVYDSVLSDDGSFVVWHSRGTFAVQNAETAAFGETVSLWDFASAYTLAPDNSLLAVSIINEEYENGAVIFFDPQSGREAGRATLGKTAPYVLAYSPDGSVLLAADADTLYLIDPQSFEVLKQQNVIPAGAEDLRISCAAPSADGTYAAILLSDGSIYLL